MAQSTNNDADKKNDLTSAATGSDVQNTYDAFEFLYNAVPYGEYPEATGEALHNKSANTDSHFE
jgi:hypothetical protein